MKTILYFLFFLSINLLPNFIFGNNPIEKQYDQAHVLYEQHQYEEAKLIYESIIAKGYENSDVHYNLGNVFFRLNQIGYAILHYEKSIKLNPNNEDAHFNLKIANLKVVSKIKPIADFILVRWTKGILHYVQYDQWAKIQIFFGFAFLLFFIIFLFITNLKLKKINFYVSILFVSCMLMSSILAWSAKKDIQSSENGVIVLSAAILKSEPTANAKEILTLREGVTFKKVETIGKYYQIRLSDGTIGWIASDEVAMI